MTRSDDDEATPIAHRFDGEGERFREWRRDHPGGTWDGFQREKRRRGKWSDFMPREAPSAEAQQRGFRREHDTGDLDARERELLAVGIAPRLTPRRVLRRFGGIAGIVLLLGGTLIGVTQSVLVALPIAIVGLALVLYELFRPREAPSKGRRAP